jgi:mannan endo-1,4-beta-mannosidase
MQRIWLFILFVSLTLIFFSCSDEEDGDTVAPTLMFSIPADQTDNVPLNSPIELQFTEKIVIAQNKTISLNGVIVQSVAYARTITITTDQPLIPSTEYVLSIPENCISDGAGNFAKPFSIRFKTFVTTSEQGNIFEAEQANLTGDATVTNTTTGFSGTGYVNTNNGNVTFTITTEKAGYYDLWMRYFSGAPKTNDLHVNGKMAASIIFPKANTWAEIKVAKLKLNAGTHTLSLIKNWGYIQLDYLKIVFDTVGPIPFNVVSSLVTTSPSPEAVRLYEFLKSNFGKKVIAGTMANHSTNIEEAIWVFNNTGKWPAMTTFDFIDHTWANQNWVKYSAPFTLGKEWWDNNGLVGLMWHWRDPLTKSGDFYTEKTTFNVSKISDTASVEYKAMIADIDVIANYLNEFKSAGIPVIWRPLHEASGKWFWWGSKGPEPCKALWKLMFDRLVKHHGLNNLIWVWTTDAADEAINWYPGDSYVDILGMDIYPGENQHGSQSVAFNKVRELFGGRKIIALSECGSVPDPALMLEYGDMWSWFMPWNGSLNRSDAHNGAEWWRKYFSYDFVLTRDKMPNLK